MGVLTVRETLSFAAALQGPKGVSIHQQVRVPRRQTFYLAKLGAVRALCGGNVCHTCAVIKDPPLPRFSDSLFQVEDILRELGLESAADVMVGDVFYQGCSGGQKRRVSIGVELVKQPCT